VKQFARVPEACFAVSAPPAARVSSDLHRDSIHAYMHEPRQAGNGGPPQRNVRGKGDGHGGRTWPESREAGEEMGFEKLVYR
jgi:hypothetical protein